MADIETVILERHEGDVCHHRPPAVEWTELGRVLRVADLRRGTSLLQHRCKTRPNRALPVMLHRLPRAHAVPLHLRASSVSSSVRSSQSSHFQSKLQIHIREEAMASMLYIYVCSRAGARYRKAVVQRCVDCMLTMLALGT